MARRASKQRCESGEFIVWLVWEGMWSEAIEGASGFCNEGSADMDFTPIRKRSEGKQRWKIGKHSSGRFSPGGGVYLQARIDWRNRGQF